MSAAGRPAASTLSVIGASWIALMFDGSHATNACGAPCRK
jgi:hypothetical protein